ncbi:MAG: hypothetical protein NTX98_01615 [Candidatus Doudnabacteria bacterium]|nr:hypothetical protein [Candidatus Doudnabacteria bacterium]
MKKAMHDGPGSQKYIETSKRDFHNVLKRILLNTPYAIADLEFEFDLDWQNLRPLLDNSCEYKIDGDKITILNRTKAKAESRQTTEKILTRAQMHVIKNIFYQSGRYLSIKFEKWPKDKLEILRLAIETGIVVNNYGTLSLHTYIRF